MDQIIIENLQVYAHHGVYQEENEKGQNFYINAIMETDTRNAGTLDELDLSTNYGEVCTFLNNYITGHIYKLIETVAEKTAEAVLLRFPLVRRITLEVRKPEAPIILPFESVSVKITRGWHRVYLSCGSNMGEKKAYLNGAVQALRADTKCRVLRVSDWIVTKPYGGVEQDDFLNGAIALETLYTPEMLLEKLHEIEYSHGRERKVHWGPRTLDLDILLYENCVMCTDDLTIPHVDMHNRRFVLEPLAQIAPYERHPLIGQTVVQMYEAIACKDIKSRSEEKRSVPKIYAKKVSLETAHEIYKTYMKTDFPPEEIKPFAVIEKMWKQDSYYVYAFYEDKAEDLDERADDSQDVLCAYAFLLADNKKRTLLLDYFAVCEDRRGEGYGSRALLLLREACADWNALLVEVENDELPDIEEETRHIRRRRIAFYTEAGCRMTDVRSLLWDVNYRIMVMPLMDEHAEECIVEKLCALYGGMYNKRELQKHFAILSE
ncbi:MAG: 2-amino-4-hydroxy-6-hydroxymethyldihydropteridine diphosphokinase [Lachnospiraceae bacterium]|nr:2-amino-4-hydroxy-6-hydroxymethyldihydropteridine diphosphokinase [Lachnospiraceae bacterium]